MSACGKCGVPLHACIHCQSFDAGARFECREIDSRAHQPQGRAERLRLFAPRVSVERETGSTPAAGSNSARKAFDDLFKF